MQFCEDVLFKLEERLMKYMDTNRDRLDREMENAPILLWHFAITQDARNYLVFFMADAVLGFARHGDSLLTVVETPEFLRFLDFIMEEEHHTFIQSESKDQYFASLNNKMMRLTITEDYFGGDPRDLIPTSVLPADPVDALFEYYPPDGQTTAPPPQVCPTDTLKTMGERIVRAKEDCRNQEQLLSAIEARKEYHDYLSGLEKRMAVLVEMVKGVTLQMLRAPDDGDSHVVSLFGRYLYFVAPPVSGKETAEEFLTLQKNLAQKFPRDEADAQACQQCSGFLPMVKEATCMPESLLSYIEQCCRQHGKRDEQEGTAAKGQEAKPAAGDAENVTKPAGKSEKTEGTDRSEASASPKKPAEAAKSEQAKVGEKAAESKPTTADKVEESLAALKLQDTKLTSESNPKSPKDEKGGASKGNRGKGSLPPNPGKFTSTSPSKLIQEADKYFIGVRELEGALQHGGGRFIFTIKSNRTVDYFCPVLGYLPLLPVLKILSIKPESKPQDPAKAKTET